jgi:molybdenum cofactor cytidylyltransferase
MTESLAGAATSREPVVAAQRLGAVLLAAGAARRFGGAKLVAKLDGRPLLQHVLDAVATLGPAATLVVLGPPSAANERLEAAISWRDEVRIRNPAPERGLASSLQAGVAAARGVTPALDGIFVVLGDQPRLSPMVLRALAAAAADSATVSVARSAATISTGPPSTTIFVPRYAEGGGANPALVLRAAWPLVDALDGDTGMAALIRGRPELVREVPVPGSNPDVDTPDDLAALSLP